MSDHHERLAALKRVTTRNGATAPEAETARRLAAELEKKLRKATRRRSARVKGNAALPEPAGARRRRTLARWAERTIAVVSGLLLVPIIIYFGTTPVMLGFAMMSADYPSAVIDWALRVKLTALAVGVLSGLLILAPLGFLVWFLRTPAGTRLRTAAAWLATFGPPVVLGVGLCIAEERAEKAYNLSGFYSITCWAATMAVLYVVVSLYYRWLGRRIVPNAPHAP